MTVFLTLQRIGRRPPGPVSPVTAIRAGLPVGPRFVPYLTTTHPLPVAVRRLSSQRRVRRLPPGVTLDDATPQQVQALETAPADLDAPLALPGPGGQRSISELRAMIFFLNPALTGHV